MNPILLAFLLTSFAGLSTGIGSAIPFFFRSFKKSYLAFFLGLSGGVMILVSFMELLPIAIESLTVGKIYWAYIAFFGGMTVVVLIDFLIPKERNPHHMTREEDVVSSIQKECQEDIACNDNPIIESRVVKNETKNDEIDRDKALKRTGIITAIAIAIHNFPEGIATFATTLSDPSLGITIAIAISIHNIPEGISVSIPIYYATKSKWKSFGLSLASGIAEPIGALVAFGILKIFVNDILLNDLVIGISLAVIAGIMVYISIDELIPVAREYGKGDVVMAGVVTGMIIMAASLVLFKIL
ncbi:MAG: zinc transporter ZupT [Candidatus Heimdallarchaeota archaeon]|nr:zinc transporter ZupT [Candidatus Heimdallarchaeota archaeon]